MKQYNLNRKMLAGTLGFLLAFLCGAPAAFSQGSGSLSIDGNLHDAVSPSQDNYGFHTYSIPDQPGKYLYLTITGGDGGKREYKVVTTCTKEGGQGTYVSGWFKIGDGGLKPGGHLRMIPGKKGADAHGVGIEGAGGGGGSGIVYRPPGISSSDPLHWEVLMVAGGGGGAAGNGFCVGSSGDPGQVDAGGGHGNGPGKGSGGTDGQGGETGSTGNGGGGWKYPGHANCASLVQINQEVSINDEKTNVLVGAGYSGSGAVSTVSGGVVWSHWEGGQGGSSGKNGPGTSIDFCGGNFNGGGFGFGGGGSGSGSGGGGGGYSGGGGGGLVGAEGNGGGGGGGSYVNTAYVQPFSVIMYPRGTTSSPNDGSIQYKVASTNPVATRDLGFEAHKGTEVSVLKAGDWTLLWQYDGNLVLYGPGFPNGAWASNTAGTDLFFQGDGNLVIYQTNADPWSSDTPNDHHNGKGGRKLVLTESGNLFIADQDNKVIWTGH